MKKRGIAFVGIGLLVVGVLYAVTRLRPSTEEARLVFVLAASDNGPDAAPMGERFAGRLAALPFDGNRVPPGVTPEVLAPGFEVRGAFSISFDGRTVFFSGRRERNEPFDIWEVGTDGSRLRQITDGPADETDPVELPDGRIVYTAQPETDPPGGLVRALFVTTRDGSEGERLTYDLSVSRARAVLPDGRILYVRRALLENDSRSQFGPEIWMTLNPDGTGVAPYVDETGRIPQTPNAGWAALDSKVVSLRRENADRFALYDEGNDRLLYAHGSDHVVAPQLAIQTETPPVLTSVVNRAKKKGWLFALNVYSSELPEIAEAEPGSLRVLRVIDLRERTALGEAKVEADGSFYIEVPADRPLGLEIATSQGKTLARLTSGIWVRPNETRGCIGCHESPELAPVNRVPDAVAHPPTVIGTTPSIAGR